MKKNLLWWLLFVYFIFYTNVLVFLLHAAIGPITSSRETFTEEKVVHIIWAMSIILSWFGLLGYLVNKSLLHKIVWRIIPVIMILSPLFIPVYESVRYYYIYDLGNGPDYLSIAKAIILNIAMFFPLYFVLIRYSFRDLSNIPRLYTFGQVYDARKSP